MRPPKVRNTYGQHLRLVPKHGFTCQALRAEGSMGRPLSPESPPCQPLSGPLEAVTCSTTRLLRGSCFAFDKDVRAHAEQYTHDEWKLELIKPVVLNIC